MSSSVVYRVQKILQLKYSLQLHHPPAVILSTLCKLNGLILINSTSGWEFKGNRVRNANNEENYITALL